MSYALKAWTMRSSGSLLEHTGVDLSLDVVCLEGLDDEVIGVIALTSHFCLEHLDHGVVGAGTADLAQHLVQLILSHQLANVVEGTSQVVFVDCAVLVNVHKFEALLVHLKLVFGETAFILSLAHGVCCVLETFLEKMRTSSVDLLFPECDDELIFSRK